MNKIMIGNILHRSFGILMNICLHPSKPRRMRQTPKWTQRKKSPFGGAGVSTTGHPGQLGRSLSPYTQQEIKSRHPHLCIFTSSYQYDALVLDTQLLCGQDLLAHGLASGFLWLAKHKCDFLPLQCPFEWQLKKVLTRIISHQRRKHSRVG